MVGEIPAHLPPLSLPSLDPSVWRELLLPAFLISVVGFIESVSLAQMLAARRRERISPDQELIGLGSANLAAAFTSGMPVTGSLSRTVINFDAGARTPAAGALAAFGVGLVILCLTPLIAYLPIATLAASIIVSAMTLVDLPGLKRTWRYSQSDFAAMLITIVLTFLEGVEAGVMAGVGVSLALYLYRTSRLTLPWWAGCRVPSTFATCAATRPRSTPRSRCCGSTRVSISPTPAISRIPSTR
ncbi:SulP family inorganic anion transporter [Salinicola tamaricis]|uniref:SulP family inorganic anion transporter n=1 Tax=Salinicola tamaricis TaxID=1771309 RepID=UPI0030F39DDA